MRQIDPAPVQIETVPLAGGLDLHTPPTQLKPGYARQGVNWVVSETSGYRRGPGYERFDGRQSPFLGSYRILEVSMIGALSDGDTVTGITSGATGVIATIYLDRYLVLTSSTGSFQDGENLSVGGSSSAGLGLMLMLGAAVSATPAATVVSISPILPAVVRAQLKLDAEAVYRAAIQKPPGSGAIRGVFKFNGNVYAWRDNVGATACALWKSSVAGWVSVPFAYEVSFTAGGASVPVVGATLTKGGVTATLKSVSLTSGTWSGSTAAGRLVISAPSGGAFSAGAATLSGGINVTLSGAEAAQTFSAGGRFEHVIADFASGDRVYGCNGANYAFEFDGTNISTIRTGMTVDAPNHIQAHANRLFLSFGPSVQFSGTGSPFVWSAVLGAGEIRARRSVTALHIVPGGENAAMMIATIEETAVLYGTSSSDFKYVEHSRSGGAAARSVQAIGGSYFFGPAGLTSFNAVQQYGNFASIGLTDGIRSFVQERAQAVTDSCINHGRSQYRIFFSDGYGLIATIVANKYLGSMPVRFKTAVNCVWNSGAESGNEKTYFGGADGMVYQLDVGTSFDGDPIDASFATAFNFSRGFDTRKRFRKARIEVQGESYAEVAVKWELDYGGTDIDQSESFTTPIPVFSGTWDDGSTWGDADPDFGSRSLAPVDINMTGTGSSLSMTFSQYSPYWPEWTVNSIGLHYSPRRIQR